MKKRIIALAILSAFSVSAYAASEALVVQDGSLNNAQVTQTDNITPTYASVHQTGTSNQADVSQEQGNDTTALVNSIGNGNQASVVQDNAWWVDATIQQNGNQNNARIVQDEMPPLYADRSAAVIEQGGNLNTATINQIGTLPFPSTPGTGVQASVLQQGNSNTALINQTGNSPNSTARIEQVNGELASSAEIGQTGPDNNAYILQEGGWGNQCRCRVWPASGHLTDRL